MAVITPEQAVTEVDVDLVRTALEHNARVADEAGYLAYRDGRAEAAIAYWQAAGHYRAEAGISTTPDRWRLT